MRIRNAQNMTEPDFWEQFFPAENAGNMPEIAVFADFHRTFSLYFIVFFHTKTLFITMPTIKLGSIVNKTGFCSRDFLKIAGTADFRRKNSISWILYFIFFHEILHTDAKWQYLKCDGARFSKNIYFWPKMPEKPVYWHFLEISSFVFPDFLPKDAY